MTFDNHLRIALSDFDGKATTLLGEAEAKFGSEPGYVSALIALSADHEGKLSAGATWLIKSALEQKRALSQGEVCALLDTLPDVTDWAAQLHLCQSVQFLSIPESHAASLAKWLDPLLSHERPFLRAWSLDALFRLAETHVQFGPEFDAALDQASDDPAASVRARARNLSRR